MWHESGVLTPDSPSWAVKYMTEVKGLLSMQSLDTLRLKWELEETDPEAARQLALVRRERSPAMQARRQREREAERKRRARQRREARAEAARLKAKEDLEAAMRAQAEAAAAARAAEAAAKAAAEAKLEAEELDRQRKKAAAEAERRARLLVQSATRIQSVYRARLARRAHLARFHAPVSIVSILGGPGSGKTTLCTRLIHDKTLDADSVLLRHISTGELLRQTAKARSHDDADLIRTMMADGEPVPDEIVCSIIASEIRRSRYQFSIEAEKRAMQAEERKKEAAAEAEAAELRKEEARKQAARTVWVGGIARESATAGIVEANMSDLVAAGVVSVNVREKDGENKCWALVSFAREVDAYQAVELGEQSAAAWAASGPIEDGAGTPHGERNDAVVATIPVWRRLPVTWRVELLEADRVTSRAGDYVMHTHEGDLDLGQGSLRNLTAKVKPAPKRQRRNVMVLDGFPFNPVQADLLRDAVCPWAAVFKLDCPAPLMVQRVLGGRKGVKESARSDEDEGTVNTAIDRFERRCEPLLEDFEQRKVLRHVNCGEGATIESSFADLLAQVRHAIGCATPPCSVDWRGAVVLHSWAAPQLGRCVFAGSTWTLRWPR